MSVKVETVTEPVLLGEGPHWHEKQQVLYFISVLECTLHKYEPATGAHTRTKLSGRPGFVVPVEGTTDQFLVGLENKFVIIRWDGDDGSPATLVKEIAEVDKDVPNSRINDGKADPRGRVYAGTMQRGHEDNDKNVPPKKGSLYRLDRGKVTKLADKIEVSNGLAWDVKEKAMYYIDSMERKIRRYDYDIETGEISNMKYVFDFEEQKINGVPDGTTIDTDGNLWVAAFDLSAVLKIDPRTGTVLQKLDIPSPQVTSAVFGGPNHDRLYVTTASLNFRDAPEPPSGAVFMATGLGVKGHPNVDYKI